MKKLTLILWLLLSTTVCTIAYDFQSGDLYYNITSDSTVEVTYQEQYSDYNYSGLTSAIIPESVTYNGTTYSVTSIGDDAFSGCSGLTSATIGNGVTSIGEFAFSWCSGLTSITIPNSVTSIGSGAFNGVANIIYFGTATGAPWSARSMNGYVDGYIVYSNDTKTTLLACSSAATGDITISNSVTSIGNSAFSDCSGLTSITIPNNVTSIGYRAFYGCSGLMSIMVESGNKIYDSRNKCNAIIETNTNTLIVGCQNTTIPNSVTGIGNSAFSGCSGLTSITIPNSVTSIGNSAFTGCSGLTSITIPNSVTSIGENAFYGCIGLTSVTIGNSVTSIGDGAFEDCSALTSITIPNSVTSIGERAFYGVFNIVYSGSATGSPWGAKNMNGYADDYFVYSDSTKTTLLHCSRSAIGDIVIPNSVTSIGDGAFYGCRGLTSVTIPNSVTSIGERAFYDVFNIVYSGTAEGAPWGARSMNGYVDGYFVYSDTTKTTLLTCSSAVTGEITIPNSVTSIGESAFSGCSGLTSVTIGNSVTSIGWSAFFGCSGLTSVTIGNSVTSIGDYAFYSCSGLTSVTIPTSVTSIGIYAFKDCSGLTSVVWNAKKHPDFSLYTGTLFYNSNTTSFTFGDSVQHIPAYICKGMSDLISINIGSSVTSIGGAAFSGCTNLTSVTWNAKNYADCTNGSTPFYESSSNFDLRSQITSFVFGDSVQHIPAYICSGMDKLASIHIGKDVMSIGNCAFAGCTSLTYVKWSALDYTATNPFYCNAVGDVIGFDLRKQITSFVCSDSIYAISPNICAQMTNLDTLIAPTIIWDSEDVDVEHQPKNLKYIKLLNGELTETIQSILSGSRKTIRTLDLGGVSNTEIPDEAFREFYKMDTLVLPAQLTKIPYKAVSECVALQSIVVPEGVTEIEYSAFLGCSGLETLSLPSTLQSIADNGFASCSALKEMRVHAQIPPTVYANTFSGVKRTIQVYVPQSAYNDYTTAEVWKEFFIQSDVADDVENVPSNDTRNQTVHKVLRNGQIYILRGGKTYTADGRQF